MDSVTNKAETKSKRKRLAGFQKRAVGHIVCLQILVSVPRKGVKRTRMLVVDLVAAQAAKGRGRQVQSFSVL